VRQEYADDLARALKREFIKRRRLLVEQVRAEVEVCAGHNTECAVCYVHSMYYVAVVDDDVQYV